MSREPCEKQFFRGGGLLQADQASEESEPVQLTLDDELRDDLDFGAWVESLPVDQQAA